MWYYLFLLTSIYCMASVNTGIIKRKTTSEHGVFHRKPKRREVLAAAAGLMSMAFIFMLFNSQLFYAKLNGYFNKPDNTSAVSTIVTPSNQSSRVVVPKEPRIIIPKIGVDAPLVTGLVSVLEPDIQKALQDGVVHYPVSSVPGTPGKSILIGHSSNAPWVPGKYKFVFMRLEELVLGDEFMANYESTQYTYKIVSIKEVLPTDLSVLEPTEKPTMTLITCTPVGTDWRRLIVHAEQISPETEESFDTILRFQPNIPITSLPGSAL